MSAKDVSKLFERSNVRREGRVEPRDIAVICGMKSIEEKRSGEDGYRVLGCYYSVIGRG